MLRTKILGLDIYGCQEALERLDDYVDRELDEEETRKVRQHLRLCHECARKFAFEERFVRGVKDKIEKVAASEEIGALKSRVALLLRKERENGGADGAPPPTPARPETADA